MDDLKKCNICIYRQTTLVSQAIMNSIKPYYLVDKNNINVDSIYFVKNWREKVFSTRDLFTKVEKFTLSQKRFKGLINAQILCSKLYTKINFSLVNKLLKI